jgi:hypothetical protein
VAAIAANQLRVEKYAGKADVLPLFYDIRVKIDEVGDLIGAREKHITVISSVWIVSRNARRIDTWLGNSAGHRATANDDGGQSAHDDRKRSSQLHSTKWTSDHVTILLQGSSKTNDYSMMSVNPLYYANE